MPGACNGEVMDASEGQPSASTRRAKSPWWLATTSPVAAVILTIVWAALFFWSVLDGRDWDAFRIVHLSVTALLTVAYAVAAGYLARRG